MNGEVITNFRPHPANREVNFVYFINGIHYRSVSFPQTPEALTVTLMDTQHHSLWPTPDAGRVVVRQSVVFGLSRPLPPRCRSLAFSSFHHLHHFHEILSFEALAKHFQPLWIHEYCIMAPLKSSLTRALRSKATTRNSRVFGEASHALAGTTRNVTSTGINSKLSTPSAFIPQGKSISIFIS